jgi:hypothetical protein
MGAKIRENLYIGTMAGFDIGGLLKGAGGAAALSQLNPYTAIASAIPALFQGGLGIAQELKADKLARSTQRPVMQVPGAQLESLANARNMAMGDSPGLWQAQQLMARNQAGSTAAIMGSGGGGAERLAALALLDQNANANALSLGAQQEQYKVQQMMNLQGELARMQQTQEAQFLYNKDEPYRNIMAASNRLHDASAQNVHGALDSLGGSFASIVGQKTPSGMNPNVGRLMQGAGSPIGTRQAGNPTDTITRNNQRIDRANMGPQGEGPMNGLEAPANLLMNLGDAKVNTGDAATGGGTNLIGNAQGGTPWQRNYQSPGLMPDISSNSMRTAGNTPLAPSNDLSSKLGSSAKRSVLGGAFDSIAKLANMDPVDRRIRRGESMQNRYNSYGGGGY